jgi:hypothetical protein
VVEKREGLTFLGGFVMSNNERTVILKETYQFPFSSCARFTRYHVVALSLPGKEETIIGCVQEVAGEARYQLYQRMDSLIRLELRDGGGKPPILELYNQGRMIFSCILGGRRPRPVRVNNVKIIPCIWGCISPQDLWGPTAQVEEVKGGDDPPSPSSSDEEGPTLPI